MERKPDWIRSRIPSGPAADRVGAVLGAHGLATVCDGACCPNKAECWGSGTATFMLMGSVCTRSCRFCAVATGRTGDCLDPGEPRALAAAILELDLRYAVLTSVDRDDLPDRGASHFAASIQAIRSAIPSCLVEALIPDFRGAELARLLTSPPDVLAHNVETVPRLSSIRDARAAFPTSLDTLREARALGARVTKTSLMLGLGETRDELLSTMDILREAGVDILVMGQYLRPGSRQLPVDRYLHPDEFADLACEAQCRGFSSVVASPLARTSYHAREAFPEKSSHGTSV